MKYIKYLVLSFIIAVPLNAFAGADPDYTAITTDFADNKLSAYYDLRNRQSYVQVTNAVTENIRIHVQIFQHDRGCSELNFFDELTPNDTVVYNMDDIVKNDGSAVPANLDDDSYGYVVVSSTIDSVSPVDERL